jgi:hypothetical protein
MGLTNLIAAGMIIRFFGLQDFSSYLTISALISIIAIPSIGTQYSVASSVAINANPRADYQPSLSEVKKISLSLFTFASSCWLVWMLVVPFASSVLLIRPILVLAATPLALATISIAVGSGLLQGLGKNTTWRLSLLVVSILQIPAILMSSNLGLGIVWLFPLLSIPSFGFAIILGLWFPIFKKTLKSVQIPLLGLAWPLEFSFGSQFVLLTKEQLFPDQSASIGTILYLFGILTHVSSVIGATKFRALFNTRPKSTHAIWTELVTALLPLGFGAALLILETTGMESLIRTEQFSLPSLGVTVAITANAVAWCGLGSILFGRLNQVNSRLALLGLVIHVFELLIVYLLEVNGILLTWLHAVVGIALTISVAKIASRRRSTTQFAL